MHPPLPTSRFSNRATHYSKYRPGYPQAVLDELMKAFSVRSGAVFADIGAGTGILSELLLKNGLDVYAVEPNGQMREVVSDLLRTYSQLRVVDGSAEATTLPSSCADVVVVAQAFHWFEPRATRREFLRILKPDGAVGLLWNMRDTTSTQFLRQLETLLLDCAPEYAELRAATVDLPAIQNLFGSARYVAREFANEHRLHYEQLYGLVRSLSYAPEPDHPRFEAMIRRLEAIFDENAVQGEVKMRYSCKLFYGRISHEAS